MKPSASLSRDEACNVYVTRTGADAYNVGVHYMGRRWWPSVTLPMTLWKPPRGYDDLTPVERRACARYVLACMRQCPEIRKWAKVLREMEKGTPGLRFPGYTINVKHWGRDREVMVTVAWDWERCEGGSVVARGHDALAESMPAADYALFGSDHLATSLVLKASVAMYNAGKKVVI